MARHSTAQHGTARHSTAQHGTARHGTAWHGTAWHSTAQHSTAHLQWQLPSYQGRRLTRWCSPAGKLPAAPAQQPCPSGANPVSGVRCRSTQLLYLVSLSGRSIPAVHGALLLLNRALLKQLGLRVVCTAASTSIMLWIQSWLAKS